MVPDERRASEVRRLARLLELSRKATGDWAVSKVSRTLDRALRGTSNANIRLDDLRELLAHLAFAKRVRADHPILTSEGVPELLNLQPRGIVRPRCLRSSRSAESSLQLGWPASWQRRRPPRGRRRKHRAILNWREKKLVHRLKCELILYGSQEDGAFLAELPERPGCAADGATCGEAVANAEVVIREWIKTAHALGRPVPEPRGRLMSA
jgi:predicted RNase H-like HicB family nuclease